MRVRGRIKRIEWKKVKDTEHFSVFVAEGGGNKPLNVSAGKRLGNAVKRNRIKRILRELFRLNRGSLGIGRTYLIKVKRLPESLSYNDLRQEFLALFGNGDDEKANNTLDRPI